MDKRMVGHPNAGFPCRKRSKRHGGAGRSRTGMIDPSGGRRPSNEHQQFVTVRAVPAFGRPRGRAFLIGCTHGHGKYQGDPPTLFSGSKTSKATRALTWVRAQNDRSLKQLTADARYDRYYKAALAILEDKSRIPMGSIARRTAVYNFWQDDVNCARPLASRDARIVRDAVAGMADAARSRRAREEGRSQLGVEGRLVRAAARRALHGAALEWRQGCEHQSRVRSREARVRRGRFRVARGESGSHVGRNKDTLIVATDWGEKTLTTSGYPFIVKSGSAARR